MTQVLRIGITGMWLESDPTENPTFRQENESGIELNIKGILDMGLRGFVGQCGHEMSELDLIKRADVNHYSLFRVLFRNNKDGCRSSPSRSDLPVNPRDGFVRNESTEHRISLADSDCVQMEGLVLKV